MKRSSYNLPICTDHKQSQDGIDNKGFQAENVTKGPTGEKTTRNEHRSDQREKETNKAENDEHDISCGMGSCRPNFLQGCKNIACFSAAYSLIGLVTSALNSYINSQITTLEKHFNFSSSVSGFIMSCNDLGYLTTTLFISHYTRRTHIPRALAIFTLIYGISGLLCATAFFATRGQIPSPPKDNDEFITVDFTQACQSMTAVNHTSSDNCKRAKGSTEISDKWRTFGIGIIVVGMILQGIAKSPRQSYIGTYVDDNVPKSKTAVYLGVITGLSIFGPALAYTLGGVFSNMYITLEETNMSPRDPRWLGAWWLGFLIFGGSGLLAGIPLIFFPKHMRKQDVEETVKQSDKVDTKRLQQLCHEVKGLLKSVLHLVLNPTYVCLTVASGMSMMAASGVLSFLPKYMETQFTITTSKANIMLGAINVVAASIGTIAGGCITSRFKLSPVMCLKLMIGCKITSAAVSSAGFFLGCHQPVIDNGIEINSSNIRTISHCVQNCNCDDKNYFPVCGADRSSYFSPCHAGCSFMDRKTFINCSCLTTNETQTAVTGLCDQDCSTLYPYLALSFVGIFFSTLVIMPTFVVTMRSVKEKDKPLAIGFSAFIDTLIGWFPGPVIFGALVDSTCLLWKTTCSSVGACSLYDIELMRFRFHAIIIGLRVITIACYVLAFIFAVCSKKSVFQEIGNEMSVTAPTMDNEKTAAVGKKEGTHNISTRITSEKAENE